LKPKSILPFSYDMSRKILKFKLCFCCCF